MKNLSKQQILDALPVFTADADYLRIDNRRYQVMSITRITYSIHHYFGLDDTPGIDTFSLIINNDSIALPNITSHDEIKGEHTLIKDTIREYVESIKKAINF